MSCESTDKTLEELEMMGWTCDWTFHTRFLEQWNQACDKATILKQQGWRVLLVNGQDERERQDGVAYLYKKRLLEEEKKIHFHQTNYKSVLML
ncbi:MAG TPA: hypothetical protein PLK76_03265 [bacterium]|nr:hypothetical protein [bacterium]